MGYQHEIVGETPNARTHTGSTVRASEGFRATPPPCRGRISEEETRVFGHVVRLLPLGGHGHGMSRDVSATNHPPAKPRSIIGWPPKGGMHAGGGGGESEEEAE